MESNIEDAVIEMRNFVRTNYNTYLDSINTAKSDSITAENVKEKDITLSDIDPFSHNEYPAIDIYPTDIVVEPLSVGSDSIYIDYTALIAISKGDESTSAQKVSRYAEAMRGIIRDYRDLGVSTWDMAPESNITVSIYPSGETELKIATVQWRTIIEVAS